MATEKGASTIHVTEKQFGSYATALLAVLSNDSILAF
jgi:hypothetical protein